MLLRAFLWSGIRKAIQSRLYLPLGARRDLVSAALVNANTATWKKKERAELYSTNPSRRDTLWLVCVSNYSISGLSLAELGARDGSFTY